MPETLKCVRAGTRLERSRTKETNTVSHQPVRGSQNRLFILDRARPGDDREVMVAKGALRHADDRVMLVHLAAGQLVGLGDPNQLEDTGKNLERPGINRAGIASDSDRRSRGPWHRVRCQAHLADRVQDPVYLGRRGVAVHHNEHRVFLFGSRKLACRHGVQRRFDESLSIVWKGAPAAQ